VTLANHGVLFLDELAEFIAPVLDGLRQPLEEGVVRVSRKGEQSDTIVVTVEQLLSTRGDVVASTVLSKAPCTPRSASARASHLVRRRHRSSSGSQQSPCPSRHRPE
jgi:predicted ATPase with chaperone activity